MEEVSGLHTQLAIQKTKATKAAELNSKLLSLLSQVVGGDGEVPAIKEHMRGLSSSSVTAVAS